MHNHCSRSLVLVSLILVFLTSPVRADVPVFGDTFRNTAPDHAPGSPVHDAKLERGHGRWKSTSGLHFDDDKVKGGGVAEHARFSFFPIEHQRSAVVYFEAWIDPGANGWSGVGFTNGEDGPLPSVGQIWMKIDDRGRLEVRANGASNKLFKDSHQNPAFVEGMNKIRIEYNRRLNSARAWLNGVELPLGNLDKNGFVPDIRAVALQLKDNGGGLKTKVIGGGGIGGVTVGFADAIVGDQFNVVVPMMQGNHEGDPLNDVTTQFGDETWYANAETGFGPGYATNIGIGNAMALASFDPADHPGYAESSVEAIINPGQANWIGIGFCDSPSGTLWANGTVWVQFVASGVVRVRVLGISQTLYSQTHLDPGAYVGGLPVKLTFNRLTGAALVEMGESTQGIQPITVTVPSASLPLATVTAGFQAKRPGGFTVSDQFAVDDFAVRIGEEIPPLEITDEPVSETSVFGGVASFHCAAGGGVPPYSYRWQYGLPVGVTTLKRIGFEPNVVWSDIAPGTPSYSGVDTQNLVIHPVSTDLPRNYRCVTTDSNSIPTETPSGGAYLAVLEPLIADTFTTGGVTGRVAGASLDGLYTEDGNAVWSATTEAVLGDGTMTNDVAGAHVLAEVPVTESIRSAFRMLSVSANVVVGDADWIGVGFSTSALESFFVAGSGLLWARVTSEGRVVVLADATVLYAQYILTPEEVAQPVHIRVDYNTETDQPSVLINNVELSLNTSLPLGPFFAAGINAGKSGGFVTPDAFAIDDFALTGSEEIPAPAFTESPQSQGVRLGKDVTLTCTVEGGVDPYFFEWTRADETIVTDEDITVTTVANSSSLTLNDYDPSLEGYYQCTVVDSRYGDPSPAQRGATIVSDLPDFGVLWGGRAGDNIFLAEAYEPGSFLDRAEVLKTNHTGSYNLEVVLRSDSAPDSSVTYPLNVWGACHAAGEQPSPPYSYLGTTTLSGGSGHEWVQFDVPDGCLGGSSWAILTLFVDINAEEDPNAYDPYVYPDYIDYGQPHIPEINFGIDNRGLLTAWIPVIDGSTYSTLTDAVLQGAPAAQGYTVDFVNGSGDAPKPAGYLMDWVTSLVQANQYHDYLSFHLKPWDPCVYIDDAIPNPKVDVPPSHPDYDPHTYQPYMAWDTLKDSDAFTPIGGLTRHRIENAVGRRDNKLFLGFSQGVPPVPSVDMEPAELGIPTNPVDAAVLGPDVDLDTGGDSSNWLSWGNQHQYHVLVWDINHSNSVWDDGKGKLEEAFFPEAKPTAGTNTWVYLGFVKDGQTTWGNQIPCSMFDLEWYSLDAIRIWGVGGEDPPEDQIDHNALHFVTGDPSQGWTELPDEVLEDSEHHACLLVKTTPASEPQPPLAEYRVGTSCNGANPQYGEILSTTPYPGGADGVYAYCPLDGGQPYYHLFSDPGIGCQHVIKGCTPGGDINQLNDCETKSIELIPLCPAPNVDLPLTTSSLR